MLDYAIIAAGLFCLLLICLRQNAQDWTRLMKLKIRRHRGLARQIWRERWKKFDGGLTSMTLGMAKGSQRFVANQVFPPGPDFGRPCTFSCEEREIMGQRPYLHAQDVTYPEPTPIGDSEPVGPRAHTVDRGLLLDRALRLTQETTKVLQEIYRSPWDRQDAYLEWWLGKKK
jgi:hypothetical protein